MHISIEKYINDYRRTVLYEPNFLTDGMTR